MFEIKYKHILRFSIILRVQQNFFFVRFAFLSIVFKYKAVKLELIFPLRSSRNINELWPRSSYIWPPAQLELKVTTTIPALFVEVDSSYLPGWLRNKILLNSASPVAGIKSMGHYTQSLNSFLDFRISLH